MFCPECKAEYRTGFTRCGDCDIELVDQLPTNAADSHEADDSGYVVVATVQGPLEEGQVCSFLEANEIPTQVRAQGIRRLYSININGIGAVQILVPTELADTARDLLTKADHGELEIDAASEKMN